MILSPAHGLLCMHPLCSAPSMHTILDGDPCLGWYCHRHLATQYQQEREMSLMVRRVAAGLHLGAPPPH